MTKIVTILGARPQFIKASVVSHAITRKAAFAEVIVHTGQHFDANMSDVFFEELGMRPPEHHLNIHGGTHGAMTGRMLAAIEELLLAEKPAAVMVYGDTNSTLAGSLAAVKLHIPVIHIEAGLRSFNMAMPEEINRILTDRISKWLFAPTQVAVDHLLAEGVNPDRIIYSGDVMYDVALHHGARVDGGQLLEKVKLPANGYVLATIHRAENTDDPSRLAIVVEALEAVSAKLPVVWPIHPRTRAVLKASGRLDALSAKISIIDAVGYLDMVKLEKLASVIATDSGGVQKEAFFHGVPCVTLRDETEWVELVESGWNRLAPPKSADDVTAAILAAAGSRGADVAPYGKGNAAEIIVDYLAAALPAAR